jgi:hypothetical protein
MRRIIITVVILLIVVGVLGCVVVAYSFLCKGPSIQISGDSHKKEFFATFLGEYCDSLSNVTLTDVRTNVVVWDVDIKPGVAFCNFSLSLGNNAAFQEGVSRVIVPSNQNDFTLMPQTKYKITVRRAGSTIRCGVGSATFEF